MARLFDDGSSEYIQYNAAPVAAYPFTMGCWFNSDTSSPTNQTLMSVGVESGVTDDFHSIRIRDPADSDVIAYSQNSASSAFATTSSNWSTATWHHACGVWSGAASREAYLDGGGNSPETTSIALGTPDDYYFGAQTYSAFPFYMSGSLAECALWNVALTDAEVAILAAGYSPLFVRPSALVAYAPLVRGVTDRVRASPSASGTVVSAHPRTIFPAPRLVTVPAAAAATGRIASLIGAGGLAGGGSALVGGGGGMIG